MGELARNGSAHRSMIVDTSPGDDGVAQRLAEAEAELAALGRSQAVIEFETDGTIRRANENFLGVIGYTLGEIQGKHHRMFVDAAYANSRDYVEFWDDLARGRFRAGEFKRIARGGKEVWIQASYNPITDASGRVIKVVKYASDITAAKLSAADAQGQIAAIGKSQAVIEFELDGTIKHANDNFLAALGYSLEEIKGKHHRLFVDPAYASSPEYTRFWRELAAGQY